MFYYTPDFGKVTSKGCKMMKKSGTPALSAGVPPRIPPVQNTVTVGWLRPANSESET